MSVGACNLGRGTARHVAEQSKLSDKDEKTSKNKRAEKTHRSDPQQVSFEKFSEKPLGIAAPLQTNAAVSENTENTSILNKLV